MLGDVLIHRDQAKDPLQDLTLNGSVNGENGFLNSHFIIEGPHIPAYELTWSGTSLGDAFLRLKSQKTPLPLIFFRSQKTQIQDTLDLQGSLEVDLSKIVKFVELFFPVHADITNLKGTIQATWKGSLPKSTPLESVMAEKVGRVDGSFQVNMALPYLLAYGKNLSVDLRGSFSANHDRVSWVLSQQSHLVGTIIGHNFPLPKSLSSIIPMNGHKLSINFTKPLSGNIDLTEASPSFSLHGPISNTL